MPRISRSQASSSAQTSWSELSPAAAKAEMSCGSVRPEPWPSTTPRISKVARIIPHIRA